jgi:hypothetical protein
MYDSRNKLNVFSYEFLQRQDPYKLVQFCVEEGIYCLPTTELIDFLKKEISGLNTIEIGAGNGVLGRSLKIISTDSYQQEIPEQMILHTLSKQGLVKYGKKVQKMDGVTAVKTYKPDCVIGPWIMHKWRDDTYDGNDWGIDMEFIYEHVKKFIIIGNTGYHLNNPILDRVSRKYTPEWLMSRFIIDNEKIDTIWIFERS